MSRGSVDGRNTIMIFLSLLYKSYNQSERSYGKVGMEATVIFNGMEATVIFNPLCNDKEKFKFSSLAFKLISYMASILFNI